MPGLLTTHTYNGRKRIRRTPYRYVGIRELNWYDIHRLADRYRLSIVDLMALLITTNLEALGMKPFTVEDQARLSEGAADSRSLTDSA